MVETSGEKKDGIGINHKGQWGYHPLIVSLAETKELLYVQNRSGNRPSHENAAFYFDLAINQRCDKENTIAQLVACHALSAPLDNLQSNWAYMVFASLAWTLKQWSGMLVRVTGPPSHRSKQKQVRQSVVRMEFATYLNSLMLIPAQVIRSARQAVFRLLTYRPSVDCLLMLHDHITRPLRC